MNRTVIAAKLIQIIALPFLLCTLSHCTTVGFHSDSVRESIDFGPQVSFQVCTFHEDGFDTNEIKEIFSYWNEELSLYKLQAIQSRTTMLERPGFYGTDILYYLYSIPLTKQCDRILYLKGRNWKDLVFEFFTLGLFAGSGLKLEVQGAVETHTNTRGYIKGKYISTLQVLFTSPKSTLVHEGYHLLGCGHQLFMDDCYKQIARLKELKSKEETEKGFLPGLTIKGETFLERRLVDSVFNLPIKD
jgi:hypothetical protein